MNVKWDTTVPACWEETVNGWRWREWSEGGTRLGWLKWGPCPRCGHTMAVYQEALRSLDIPGAVSASCNCEDEHPNRPEGMRGCGPGSGVTIHIAAHKEDGSGDGHA